MPPDFHLDARYAVSDPATALVLQLLQGVGRKAPATVDWDTVVHGPKERDERHPEQVRFHVPQGRVYRAPPATRAIAAYAPGP